MRILFLIVITFSLGSLHAQDRLNTYFPDRYASWEPVPASDSGFNAEALKALERFAMENEYSGEKDLRRAILKGFEREPYHELRGPVKPRGGPAGMILKKGYLVHSWGDTERVDMTFSVTKSFLSTVAGLAYDQGLLENVTDKVANYVWDGTFRGTHNAKVTWEHLLQQTSDWSGSLWGLQDWADRPPREGGIDDWKMRAFREPGTHMEYNDVRVNVLAYSLTHLWRKPVPLVLKEQLMDRIGASPTWRWHGYDNAWTVIDGLKMQSVTGGGHSGGGMFISTEDMARFGLLFMSEGVWDGERIISEEWIQMATEPSRPNPNYGYLWWVNVKDGPRYWEGVPDHVYYAAGFGGNFILVDPENELVVVTRWLEPSKAGTFFRQLYENIN